MNPANPKPYLSLRVELKDLGVCVVIDPNRLNSPQISTTPRDFLNSLARAIGALVETRHTCDKWRSLQNREIVIALPIDLWMLANCTTTGDDGRTIAQALVELFPGLTIVHEVDREPVLAELAAEVKGLREALRASHKRTFELEAAGRDARDWIVEAMSRRSNGDVDEVLALAHGRLEAMNLGDGDPDAEARAHAYPDDSAGADEGRVAALERAIVEAVGLLACHDLHGDETALAARQAFEGLGIPGLVMVTRCASCAEPIEEEAETCPDCGVSLFNNVVTGLEALGHEEGDGDA